MGIEVGDLLISINGEPIHDIIEYRFLLSDEYLEVEIQKQNREIYIYEIEKDYDDDLGIEFTNPIDSFNSSKIIFPSSHSNLHLSNSLIFKSKKFSNISYLS